MEQLEARGLKGHLGSRAILAPKANKVWRAKEDRQGHKETQAGSGRRANRAKRGLKDQSG